jgi:hypothetical protein
MSKKLNEGLEPLDLKRLVKPILHIDRYKSKLGEDDDVIVLDVTIKGEDAAKDLSNFFEKGYDWILDSDSSSGELGNNYYLVFVEMERRLDVPKNIMRLVREMKNLTGQSPDEWKFKYGKDSESYPLELKYLETKIPLSPHEYRVLQDKLNAMRHAAGLKVDLTSNSTNEDINFLKRLSGLE